MIAALVLSQCLRVAPAAAELAHLSQLAPGDWERLVQLAIHQELAPLLHVQLRSTPLHALLPPAAVQQLTRAYLDAAGASLRWEHQLRQLLQQLHRCAIPALILGDAVLALAIYDNAALHSPHSLELLVREADLGALAACLLAAGYCVDPEGGAPNRAEAAVFISLKDADIPVRVYRHSLPSNAPFRVPVDEFWSHAVAATLEGCKTTILRPEALLLALCTREVPALPAKGLRLCFDLAQVVARYAAELDWERFIALAREWQAGAAAFLALSLARDLAGAAIPEAALARLAPGASSAAGVARVRQELVEQFEQPLPELSTLDALDSTAVDEALLVLSPENPLIGCLRARWDPAALDSARSRIPVSAPEWELWAGSAVRAGVGALLGTTLRQHAQVPPAIMDLWNGHYVRNLRHTTGTLRELARALEALHREGIATLLLKGAALGVAVYRNVGLRPMGDIDLLVRREDAARALALMEGLGYAATGAETRPGATLEYENEVALRHTRKPQLAPVELHWGLLDSPHYQSTLDMDWFWRTAQPLEVEGASTLMLGPEAQVLHLCAHLMLHHAGASSHLQWYHDIAEVLVAYGDALDWEALLAVAATNDLVLPLQRVLPVVWDCWQIEPPAGLRAKLAALQPSAKEAQLYAQLTAPARPVAQRFFTDLASMQGWRQRWAYAWENIFPAPAYMRERYRFSNSLLLPCAYLWRWLRGLASILGRRH
ncbi:MAG: nucleotidyltransferase family protein [Anaerolineae bacterium]|nr:nucleotidyltransferase family protein [Anaerolineae bacterium]